MNGTDNVKPAEDRETAGGGSTVRRRLATWLIPLAFWSLPAMVTTHAVMQDRQVSFGRAFMSEGLTWVLWALATPGILLLVRRLPPEPPHRGRNIVLHIGTGFAMGVLTGVITWAFAVAAGLSTESFDIGSGLVIWGLFGLMFYAATASVGLALSYHRRMRERERAASRLEAELVEARLNALRVQLQPHFLFNALNSVSMLVRSGESKTAVRMVARLSDLLRYVLETGNETIVPLRSEIDFVSRYLEIEQLRFRDRMNVVIEVDDAVSDSPVPGLLLQPLVENAVRHGVAARAAHTGIVLQAQAVAGRLEIRLRDDGPGLPPGFDESASDGIGLANTRSRLAYTFGADAKLTIATGAEGGTEVVLDLPLQGRAHA